MKPVPGSRLIQVYGLTETTGAITYLDRKSTRLNSSHLVISYAVFCLKKNKHVGLSSGDLLRQRKPFDEAIEQRAVPGEPQLAARLGIQNRPPTVNDRSQ